MVSKLVYILIIGYEPVIAVTHLDLICRDAIRQGRNWDVEVHHKTDKVCISGDTYYLFYFFYKIDLTSV